MKQFGKPLFLRGPLPFQLTPFSEQFFHDPPLCSNFKNKKARLILGWDGGRKL